MNTIYSLSQYALQELKDTYGAPEIRSICRLIFTDVLQYTNIDIHLKIHEPLAETFVNKFYEIVTELKKNKPIQYVIGETEFAGLHFGLNPATLIPRPETEELIMWIQQESGSKNSILDIGTGSGCIAISLAHLLPNAQVSGLDISSEAVEQAKKNAARNNVPVHFFIADILHPDKKHVQSYDIIVSNPPYVRDCEKKQMQKRVLDFEPHRALFVPDNDPLLFYRRIAAFGMECLNPGGKIFFEINEVFGNETVQLLADTGYTDIEIKQDMQGKDRMCRAIKPVKS